MYMCRETLRRATVQKCREAFPEFDSDDFGDLRNFLSGRYKAEDIQTANEAVNSLKVCDPAVGSGHFLVSALNELIAIKSELDILTDDQGRRLPVRVEVENDDLMVSWKRDDELFEYRPGVQESQIVQQTLFHEKQTLIENCLFGVDINPNSVKICRLRLWIELLKNAYYKIEPLSSPRGGVRLKRTEGALPAADFLPSQLETLPNIDINIKQGNSLVSRFELKGTYKHFTPKERERLRKLTRAYKEKVALYKDVPGAKGVCWPNSEKRASRWENTWTGRSIAVF